MFLPIPSALMPDGTAPFYMNDAMDIDFHLGSQGYYDGVLRGTVTAIDAADQFSGGVRYTQAGILRLVDATAGLPAGAVTLGGFAFSKEGQLCVTTDAITAASKFIAGVAVQQDGTVHFVDVSPVAKFRKGIGQTVTGAGVSQWDDVSGNDNHLLQGTDANRPALQADGSILFDGVDNFLKTAAFAVPQPFMVYALISAITWTEADFFWDGETQNNNRLIQTGSSPNLQYGDGTNNVTLPGIALGIYGAYAILYNGASSSGRISNGTPATGNAGTNNLDGFILGSTGAGASNWSNIQVKEVILCSGAHTTARQNWEINRLLAIT